MTDARSKLLVRAFLIIAGLVAAVILLYRVMVFRPTGYGEVKANAGFKSEERRVFERRLEEVRSEASRVADGPVDESRARGSMAPYDELSPLSRHWARPVLLDWYTDEPLQLVAEERSYSALEWFPLLCEEHELRRLQLQLRNTTRPLHNEAVEEGESNALPGIRELRLSWRYVHASIVGDEPEALRALTEWAQNLGGPLLVPGWKDTVYDSITLMLENVAALENEAPDATFAVIESMLLTQLSYYDHEGSARRLMGEAEAEYSKASQAGIGDGALAFMLNGSILKAQKNLLLPLLKAELDTMAAATLKGDYRSFDSAYKRYTALKARFPDSWGSEEFYDMDWVMLEVKVDTPAITAMKGRRWLTLDEHLEAHERAGGDSLGKEERVELVLVPRHAAEVAIRWSNSNEYDKLKERELAKEERLEALEHTLETWLEAAEEKEELQFFLSTLQALEHRYRQGQWPEEDPGVEAMTGQHMMWVTPRPVLKKQTTPQTVTEAFLEFRRENGNSPSREELAAYVSEELVPKVLSSFFEFEPRPLYYRPSTSYPGSYLTFVPTTFSDDFRRFMRGEDGE